MYTDFYGLREKPFALSPDPRFLFLAESHREALAHLLFGIEQGEGFIAISGEVGTGKTTLCRTLLQRIEPTCEVSILFNPQLSAQELMETINLEFGLDAEGKSRRELMDQLNEFLLARKEAGRRVLLIVDEAQTLSPEALEQIRLLSNLETETSKLIQIILLGQPEFDVMLESPALRQLRQRVSVRWRLAPLTASESAEYVRHRLRVAAGAERDLFSDVALREIHRRSGGVPRIVNLLADRALLAGYAAGARSIGLPLVAQAERELRGGAGSPTLRPGARRTRLPIAQFAAGLCLVAVGVLLVLLWQRLGLGVGSGAPEPVPRAAASQAVEPNATPESPVREERALAVREPAQAVSEPRPVPAAPAPVPEAAIVPGPAPEPGPVAGPSELFTLREALAATSPGVSIARALDAALQSWGFAPVSASSLSLDAALAELRARDFDLRTVNQVDVRALSRLGQPAFVSLLPDEGEARPLLLRSVGESLVEVVGLFESGQAFELTRRQFDERVVGQAVVIWRDFEALPHVLRQGQSGPKVQWLQESLHALGFHVGPVTGRFDASTRSAVLAFQRSRSLVPDGEAGQRTQMALYAELEQYPVPRLTDLESDDLLERSVTGGRSRARADARGVE
jgi:general secretion pathway protein A